jgi:hypothetical protein
MPATVKVNAVPYDFKSLQVTINANGEDFGILRGIDEIEYQVTINREKFYGGHRVPILRTDGEAEHEGSLTMHRAWYNFIVRKAKELGIGLAMLKMTIAVTYEDPTGDTFTDTLTDVAIGEIGNSHSNGPEHLMVTIPLDIMNVYYDGVDVFGDRLAA